MSALLIGGAVVVVCLVLLINDYRYRPGSPAYRRRYPAVSALRDELDERD